MSLLELLKRATPSSEPVFTGEWAALAFRPDLGSQQEFIVGLAAIIKGDNKPYIKWLPSLSKLSSLYGDAISSSDALELFSGSEMAMVATSRSHLSAIDSGTPHIRVIPCGYLATDDVEIELTNLLKRHSGALWVEPSAREPIADNDWAYSMMRQALNAAQAKVFVPSRTIAVGNRNIHIGLDNGESYGNIVSARYSTLPTIERHINSSLRQLVVAHHLTRRDTPPALFVVLPNAETSVEGLLSRKTASLLDEVEDMGIAKFCDRDPPTLARQLEEWAIAAHP